MIYYLIGYFAMGYVSYILACRFIDDSKEVLVRDCFVGICAGLMGPVVMIIVILGMLEKLSKKTDWSFMQKRVW